MADEKLNTGPAENTSPEAAGPITTPEQAAASEPRQEQTGPAIPESGDVVVSFDKINELMAEKRQNARAEVEKAETPETPEAAAPGETPQPANTEEPKKPRRGRPPKAEKAATENQKAEKTAGARKGRPPKADKAAPDKPKPSKRDKVSRSDGKAPDANLGKFQINQLAFLNRAGRCGRLGSRLFRSSSFLRCRILCGLNGLLDRIGDRKTAVFFIISDTTQTYNFLVALAFSQMFNLLCERADNVHGGRLPHHVRVLWDEAANTGQVPQLEKLVAVIRSREVSLCLLYQQLAQCKAIYDKHAETILGNMDSVVFLGGREASTIKEISENWLGKATISMQTDSRSRGQSESYSQNTQRLGRELMTPAELATMPGDKCILQLRGLPPFFSPKYDLKRHPNYRYTAEADKQKNAFDLDRLINRRRRPGLNEACTMYEVTVPDDALTEEDEDILNYDDIDDPDAFA